MLQRNFNTIFMGRNVVSTMINDYEQLNYMIPLSGIGVAKAFALNRMSQAGHHSLTEGDFEAAFSTSGRPVLHISAGFDTVLIIHDDDMDEVDDMLEAFEE